METSELLRNISRTRGSNLPVVSTGLAEEMLAGNFRSIFKGQGIEFDEARHYQIGDDIRSIDWNASARFGTPFVKMYREERELTIFILLDISPSMHRSAAAQHGLSPYEQALLCAALIAFSAEHTDQRVGGLFFDRDAGERSSLNKIFPPKKGRSHIMKMIMAALQIQNNVTTRKSRHGSNLAAALTGAQRLLKKRSLVVVISDFFSMNWEQELTALCRKHDCIALRICDPDAFPLSGLITLEDPETGVKIEAPAGLASFKDSWDEWHTERAASWEAQCKRAGASFLELRTDSDAPSALMKFFGSRKKA